MAVLCRVRRFSPLQGPPKRTPTVYHATPRHPGERRGLKGPVSQGPPSGVIEADRIALAWDAQSQRCPNQAAKREFAIARKDCASEEWGHPLQNRTGWCHMSSLYLARSKFRLLPHKSLVQCALKMHGPSSEGTERVSNVFPSGTRGAGA